MVAPVFLPSAPLLATKVLPPPVRGEILARPRLVERLTAQSHHKLTLISAPAGSGKTTLLSQWLAGTSHPISWIALDAGDNDAASFWACLTHAFHTTHPILRQQSLGNPPPSTRTPWESFLTALTHGLDLLQQDLTIVLDDYHVIQNQAIHDGVNFLLDHMPSRLRFVIATRSDPPLHLARLRVRGDLNELRSDDLCFTFDESCCFLNELMRLSLSEEELGALQKHTEGWAAGLRVAAISLRSCENTATFIEAFAGTHQHVLDFLVEEVLRHQPESVQRFMLETSILERLSAFLCQAVTRERGSQAMLELLDKGNLFIVPLDNQRRWYRYHRLFSDVLRTVLERTEANRVPALHRRAAGWYLDHGFVAEALKHTLAAGDVRTVTDFVGQVGSAMGQRGDVRLLRAPVKRGRGRSAKGEDEAWERAMRNPAWTFWWHNDVVNASEILASICEVNDAVGETASGAHTLQWLAGLQASRGQLHKAADTYHHLLRLVPGNQGSAVTDGHLGLGWLHYEWNDLELAFGHVSEVLGRARQEGMLALLLEAYSVLARIEQATGNGVGAIDIIGQAVEIARTNSLAQIVPGLEAYRVRLWLAAGEVDKAARWARAAESVIAGEPAYQREAECLSLARVEVACGQPAEALRLLGRLLEVAEGAGRTRRTLKIAIARALAFDAQGDGEAARAALEQALLMSEPEGYVRSFADEGPPMEALLKALSDWHAVGSRPPSSHISPEYMGKLLAAVRPANVAGLVPIGSISGLSTQLLHAAANGESSRGSGQLVARLSERELEVLRLIATGASSQEIACRLIVALSTVKKHLGNIYGKLDAGSRTEALAIARKLGLIS